MMKYFTLCIFLLLTLGTYAQVNVSYYSGEETKVGLGYEKNRFAADLSIYGITLLEDISPEVTLTYSILKKETWGAYLGAGVRLNVYDAFVLPVGIQFTPFKTVPNLFFDIRANVLLGFENDNFISPLFGVKYRLFK